MRFVARTLAILVVAIALPVIGAAVGARNGAIGGTALSLLGWLWLWLWLPRIAHDAFDAGRYKVAGRRYRWLQRLVLTAARERAAILSRAGCAVAVGETANAEALLGRLEGSALTGAERAVWLNNRACAQLAASQDAAAALALADEAVALRPDVPALQHTRAMALIALGRIDDAITILDGMRVAGELPPRLEADRCRELSRAWERKGEAAYAEDYRLRANAYSR